MKINMGEADRVIRIAVAATIALLCYINIITGAWAIVLLILSAVFLLTGFIGWCPLYSPFSINTCKKN